MHHCSAYGLAFHSDIPLPELIAAPASSIDSSPALRSTADGAVRIVRARIDRQRPPHFAPDAPVWATPDAAFLEFRTVASFLVTGGREIKIDAVPGADERLIRLFLLGPVLGLLLHQRNYLVLHASGVAVGGEVLAFVGDKGMGKSTIAAALHAAGHALVADDLVAVDTHDARRLVYPGFPQLKLFPASAALLEGDPACLPRVHPDLEKRARRATEGFTTAPIPLGRIFVLEDAADVRIIPVAPRPGFMELVRHSYLLGFLGATQTAAAHFRQAISLAARVPVARLLRPRSFDALPDVVRLLEAQRERAA